ncbi:MAG: hypothetical protein CMF59_12625 [Leptospiraceae bacterium]|nr:hypothetical protein [Leptospiraceae bacterium]
MSGDIIDLDMCGRGGVKRHFIINLMYPDINSKENNSSVELNLYHVRSSDGIQIQYDGDRDGWSIQQAYSTYRQIKPNYSEEVEHWEEVAFIKSWALQEEKGEELP